MDETYGTYVDDEYVDNHDYDDDIVASEDRWPGKPRVLWAAQGIFMIDLWEGKIHRV